jgi:hypothetical protein
MNKYQLAEAVWNITSTSTWEDVGHNQLRGWYLEIMQFIIQALDNAPEMNTIELADLLEDTYGNNVTIAGIEGNKIDSVTWFNKFASPAKKLYAH